MPFLQLDYCAANACTAGREVKLVANEMQPDVCLDIVADDLSALPTGQAAGEAGVVLAGEVLPEAVWHGIYWQPRHRPHTRILNPPSFLEFNGIGPDSTVLPRLVEQRY